jgi:hypothetical protein
MVVQIIRRNPVKLEILGRALLRIVLVTETAGI